MRIYIIGFMGSGKSSYGQELAEEIGYSFVDLDREIEKQEKASINDIFNTKSEDYFREAEHKALLKTEADDRTIIATGGGAPCFHDGITWMNDHGYPIYLKLFEDELKKRIEPGMAHRPLLAGIDAEGLEGFIHKTLKDRAYYYHQARMVIDPVLLTPANLAEVLKQNNII